MSCAIDRDEGERTSRSGNACNFAINFPFPKRLRLEFIATSPFEAQSHALIGYLLTHKVITQSESKTSKQKEQRTAYPIAAPVIRADIDQHSDSSIQKTGNLIFGREIKVQVVIKCLIDLVRARCKISNDGGVDTKSLANTWEIKIGGNRSSMVCDET